MKFITGPLIAVVLVLSFAQTTVAQSVDFVYGVGRAFDIPSASWMNFYVPALEVSSKGFTVNIAHFLELKTSDSSETDLTVSYRRQKENVTLSLTAAQIFYHMKFTDPAKQRSRDWRLFGEMRFNLRK